MRRKGPLPGKICALCIPERRFAGLLGYMAREYCQSQLVLDTRRRYVARKGRFSRPRPLRGCMKREYCHGWPPGNAPRENIATDGRPGTHHGEILPPSDVGGAARKAGSRAGIRGGSAQGTVARRDSRSGSTRTTGSRSNSTRKANKAQKKRRSEERRLPRKTTGANQIRPES